ncbi:MAG: MBL fold metallo-hydrolase [Candidatus Promineifilaceae bacterium]
MFGANGDFHITYIGHSTVLIEIDGVRLLTDPLLRRRVAHLGRLVDLPDWDDWDLDAVLISHLHWDHMDPPSLRRLGNDTRIIVPAGTRTYLRNRGFHNVTEIGVEEQIYIRGVRIMATQAEHAGGRPVFGPTPDSVGYVIEGEHQVYFAGDTDLFPEMTDIGRRNLDVALLPVWGYGPTLGAGHLDPYRAAQALSYLQPRAAIPIHWGTYCPMGMNWIQMPFLHHPPYAFESHAGIIAPEVEVVILEPGESYANDQQSTENSKQKEQKTGNWEPGTVNSRQQTEGTENWELGTDY